MSKTVSIILPARNEAGSLTQLLDEIGKLHPEAEIIVVNDGSTDNTAEIALARATAVVNHPYSMGNGSAVKSGARASTGETLVFMDADGQHQAKDIQALLDTLEQGYDMVIGARTADSHASTGRRLMNLVYNRIASFMTGFTIEDLTSGFRAVKAHKFKKFLYLLPNGFSYPTTVTMAFLRSGFPLRYIDIETQPRSGDSKSKIIPLTDGLRFFIIILKIGSLFSPMRLFLPISTSIFFTGVLYYGYTYMTQGRFTNMSALLFLSALFIFLIGILAEQVSALHYQTSERDQQASEKNRK